MTATVPDHRRDTARQAAPLPLRSLVPAEVTLAWADRQVHLAPLGLTVLSASDVASIDPARLADCKFVQREEPVVEHRGLGWFAVVAIVAAVALAVLVALTDGWWPMLFLAIAVIGAATGVSLKFRQGAIVIGQWVRDKAAVLLVLGIGFAAPAASLLFATRLFQDLTDPTSHRLQPPLSTTVTLRALQVLFLGVAITFPALLFFLFDRQRADMLRKRFQFHMFRFDPRVTTLPDVEAYYGLQMDASFGSSQTARGQGRPQVSHRAPIVIMTIVLAVGWIVASINLQALAAGAATGTTPLADLFKPDSSVLAFGFLGSYYFAVNMVLRSYVRGDLHPKTYSQITTRVLEVVVVTALLSVTDVIPHELAVVVAFFAGVVPDIVLQRFWEVSRRSLKARGPNPLAESQPITELEGIDIYERARLAGEGVENVEALAHGNLVDLLLQTRIPAGRLIDWVDQAILYLHTTAGQHGSAGGNRGLFDALRGVYVRSATDLLRAASDEAGRQRLVSAVGRSRLSPDRLELLVSSIKTAPWMTNLERWRANPQQEPVIYFLEAQPAT